MSLPKKNPSRGWCSLAGRSFLLALAAVGLVVLLALLVLCVVTVVVANRELAALGGRIAELEAGGWSLLPEDGGAAASDFGFRRCSECATGFSCDFPDFVYFAALLFASY